jgi:Ala-tRNA(Pro) deacylase
MHVYLFNDLVIFSNDKVKALLGAKDIRFAIEEEVMDITQGVKPGAVPPFGNLFGLEVITDSMLYDNEKIVFNAGERTFSVAMKSEDYQHLVKPRLASIV